MNVNENEHIGKQNKPAKDHPWKKCVPNEVMRWARQKSHTSYVTNYKKGGGFEPWNK